MGIVATFWFWLIAVWLGFTLIQLARLKWGFWLTVGASSIIGPVTLTLVVFYLAWLFGFTNLLIIISLGLITLILAFFGSKPRWRFRLKIRRGPIIQLGFIVAWAAVLALLWSRMLIIEPDGLYAGWVNIWGDWAAHLSYMSSFAFGDNFPPRMPILVGATFSYPFLADFLPAILIKLGNGLTWAMLWPSWWFSVILVILLVEFGRSLGGQVKAGLLTANLFLLNGGLGFFWAFQDIRRLGFTHWLQNIPQEYTHLEAANIEWINLITSQVIPQRGFLLGFPLSLVIYLLLWQYWKKRRPAVLILAGGLTGLLPLVHAHSLILVLLVAGCLFLFDRRRSWPHWLAFGSIVALVSLPQLLYFYGHLEHAPGFIRWQPGWLAQGNIGWFWLKNFGLTLLAALIGLKLAPGKLRWFSLPFWLMFLLAHLWIWQPWPWDNTKILTHWYLLVCLLASLILIRIPRLLAAGLLTLMILSGILDVWRLSQYDSRKLRMVDNEAITLAGWVRQNTPPKSLFLTADNHDHWVPLLTGRPIVIGFKGWLWTYGLNYGTQEQAAGRMFFGGDQAAAALNQYGVNYLIIGPVERSQKINEVWYDQNYPLVYQLGPTKIYKIN